MNNTSTITPSQLTPVAGSFVPAPNQAPSVPTVQIGPGRLNENLDVLAEALAATGRYFQSAGRLVTLNRVHGSGVAIQEVSATSLLRDLDSLVIWQRIDKRSGDWVRCETPTRHCRLMLDSVRHQQLQPLLGVARQPYLRADGTLCVTAGYDRNTGLFGDFDAAIYAVPSEPTRADAEAALDSLVRVLTEFPFAGEHDRSAALAALLTAVVRPSLQAAPMFHVRAPQYGSGKSYLCALITAFASANPGALIAFPSSDEECTKVLISELKRSPAVIEFDNLTTDILPYKSLCSALTGQYLSGRELGQSKMVQVTTNTLVLSSGNNVGPVRDMGRRCVTISLDAHHDTPATRAYTKPNLVSEVLANRARYAGAALTLVRAWICAGRPITACQPVAGYTEWSAWCRQPLLWLGLSDPAKPVFEAMAHDPERDRLRRLLRSAHAIFGDAPLMVRTLIGAAQQGGAGVGELMDLLQEIAGDRGTINTRRLGHWIAAQAGRQVDGLKLIKHLTVRSSVCWKVVSTSNDAAVSLASSIVQAPHDAAGAVGESVVSVVSVMPPPDVAQVTTDGADTAVGEPAATPRDEDDVGDEEVLESEVLDHLEVDELIEIE
jgi:hypothetical protein